MYEKFEIWYFKVLCVFNMSYLTVTYTLHKVYAKLASQFGKVARNSNLCMYHMICRMLKSLHREDLKGNP